MTIKALRDILIHYQGSEYDDWKVNLFDYNNQRDIKWNEGMYSSSKNDKVLTFPIEMEPIDGVEINRRIEKVMLDFQREQIKNALMTLKEKLAEIQEEFDAKSKEIIEKLNNN